MTVARRLALLSALALTGCVATRDEPFPLDDGDAVAAAAKGYVCDSYDAKGKKAAAAQQGRLVALRRNKTTQYVFVDDKSSSAEPFTLHRAKGDFSIVAVALSEGPGENLYLAQFADARKEFKLYAESDAFAAHAPDVARRDGATFAPSQFSNDIGGPLEAQKAFMLDMASDPTNWKVSADCRAKR